MPSISDIEQLRYLHPISRQFGVTFRLKGGVAFRALLAHAKKQSGPLDLFDLAPLTSDVDLVHSGSEKQSASILQRILEEVPDSECFRWEVRSQESQRYFDTLQPSGGILPARMISLTDGPSGAIVDPLSGYTDIVRRNFRYELSPFFKEAPLYRAGRDLPAFSALLYLQTLFEAHGDTADIAKQSPPEWRTASRAFAMSSDRECQSLLQQHAYLRARLLYLLINAFVSAPNRPTFVQAAKDVGLTNFIMAVSASLGPNTGNFLLLVGQVEGWESVLLCSSSRLLGDTYRVPLASSAQPAADHKLRITPVAPRQYPVLTLPPMQLNQGAAPSANHGTSKHEFIYYQFPPETTNLLPWNDQGRDVSAIAAFSTQPDADVWHSLALPCVVQRRGNLAQVRLNFFGYLEALTEQGVSWLRVCIVALSSDRGGKDGLFRFSN